MPLLFAIVLEILARAIRLVEDIKVSQIEKEGVKLSLFAGICLLVLTVLTKLFEWKTKISCILYTNNEQSKRKLRNSIYNSSKKNKILRNKHIKGERLVH